MAEEFSVWGDDSDVEVGDEDDDLFVVVVSSDADVVEASVVAGGDGSVVVIRGVEHFSDATLPADASHESEVGGGCGGRVGVRRVAAVE